MSYKFHYIIDSKLLFYGCKQTGRDVLETFNEIGKILVGLPKGHIYVTADLGSSEYRLAISKYYKGKRKEQKIKQSPEEKAEHKVFGQEYLQFVELCKKLPVIVMNVPDTEADDVASILAYELAKDPLNRISLFTRDQDWLHSVIDDKNVKLVSPYYSEADMYSRDACRKYTVATREEFTLKKTLEGDDGDSILHPKWLGKKATDTIWENCLQHDEVTLEVVREEMHAWIEKQNNPGKYTVPYKYIEYDVASTIDEVLNVNYKLAATMTTTDQLSTPQQEAYHNALARPYNKMTLDPFNDGILYFGRPIVFTDNTARLFREA